MTPAEQAARDLATDYAHTFGTDAGKRVLADLKRRARCHEPSYIPGLEPWQPAYRDGAKSILGIIHEEIKKATDHPNTNLTPTVKK